MKQKFIDLYMDWADRTAQLSHARRLQVGAVIVKDDSVISYGYNGMPAGWDNNCENEVLDSYSGFEGAIHSVRLKTKPEVLHAESNAIAKLAKSTSSGDGASIFITHAPCHDCAKLIYQSGINSVYYRSAYRDNAGLDFLTKSNVSVTQIV
jgi:dCMP deaminase